MKGKQIAENLKQNRDKWTRSFYHLNGKYCVIGLKLHEMGVPVEEWERDRQAKFISIVGSSSGLSNEKMNLLVRLQRNNDSADNVDELISWAEGSEVSEIEFPLEELAAALKPSSSTEVENGRS